VVREEEREGLLRVRVIGQREEVLLPVLDDFQRRARNGHNMSKGEIGAIVCVHEISARRESGAGAFVTKRRFGCGGPSASFIARSAFPRGTPSLEAEEELEADGEILSTTLSTSYEVKETQDITGMTGGLSRGCARKRLGADCLSTNSAMVVYSPSRFYRGGPFRSC
jgi:hypothetical protein